MYEGVAVWSCVGVVALLLILVVRLLITVGKIQASMAKIGYVIREDGKKYFDDAAATIVETNERYQEKYVGIVKNGTAAALTEAGAAMEGALAKAQNDAGQIILNAREEARRIVEASKNESVAYKKQALEQSTATIQWVMEQYAGQTITAKQHEELIKKLVDQYAYENRN